MFRQYELRKVTCKIYFYINLKEVHVAEDSVNQKYDTETKPVSVMSLLLLKKLLFIIYLIFVSIITSLPQGHKMLTY